MKGQGRVYAEGSLHLGNQNSGSNSGMQIFEPRIIGAKFWRHICFSNRRAPLNFNSQENHLPDNGKNMTSNPQESDELTSQIASNCKTQSTSNLKLQRVKSEPQSRNRQIINLHKKVGFPPTPERALLAQKVRFCTLLGALSGIGGNPTFRAD